MGDPRRGFESHLPDHATRVARPTRSVPDTQVGRARAALRPMLGGMRRMVATGIAAVVAVGLLGHCSGNQPRLDAVAAARRELGIPLEARRVDVGDVELFVVQAGPRDGPPVVLLHGFPEFWYAWKGAIAPLATAGYRVIVPDQRGYGDSDKPRDVDGVPVDRLGDDVANLIAALGHERAFVVGARLGRRRRVERRDPPSRARARSSRCSTRRTRTSSACCRRPARRRSPGTGPSSRSRGCPKSRALGQLVRCSSKMLRDTARPGAFPDEKLDLYRSAWDRDGAYGTMVNWYRAAYRFRAPTDRAARRVTVPTLVLVAADDAFIPGDLTRASVELCDDAGSSSSAAARTGSRRKSRSGSPRSSPSSRASEASLTPLSTPTLPRREVGM